jgi:NADPH-dependent curcumin reductase CurA
MHSTRSKDRSFLAANWGTDVDNFRLEEVPMPQPGPGQMLLRTLWLPLDPSRSTLPFG